MWTVLESGSARKELDRAPQEIQEKFEAWRSIVEASGSEGLREVKGLHDEALSGKWAGHRSSRLNLRYRVIYRVERERQTIYVMRVTAHDYRR
jgi:addiction module RelE/StbE family toxin